MAYILTLTAKRKDAKRHIAAKSCNLDQLRKSAELYSNKYRKHIYTGNWELIEEVKEG